MSCRQEGRRRWRPLELLCWAVAIAVSTRAGSACAGEGAATPAEGLRERAVGILRETLRSEERWVKVHAAEYLLKLDYPQGVAEAFGAELARFGSEPQYRIGIWRVLARAAVDPREREKWLGRIREVFVDPAAPDHIHAAETLGKFPYVLPQDAEEERAAFERAAKAEDLVLATFARLVLSHGAGEKAQIRLVAMVDHEQVEPRVCAAYSLRHVPSLSARVRKWLAAKTKVEPRDSAARVMMVAALAVHTPAEDRAALKAELLELAATGDAKQRYQACEALAIVGEPSDLPALVAVLDAPEADPRSAAAYAILRIQRRAPHRLVGVDWGVIAVYVAAMIAIGWYYSRRVRSAEDYLLGGRQMNAVSVGLSLFATMLSTISYLSVTGEIIQNGPMYLAGLLAYPIIFLVVGYLLIPFFMRLRITSAYEVLERRLGLSTRMLGSAIFLLLRLLWMATIVYMTTSAVLVPLVGWPQSAVPYVCAALGFITVIYTAMGGLRAVVLTDVIQTVILFGAALLTVALITGHLHGFGGWWPGRWAPTWQRPQLGLDLRVRGTALSFFMATLTWFVCTYGSDQMAIQRYLATRDANAARRLLLASLLSSTLVMLFLAALGLALLAYFRGSPHLLPDGKTILTGADGLFPRFILIGLPAGVSGLVVAGLLAAAMSSLSSGLNSSCSVVTVDFIDRFRQAGAGVGETDHVRLAKYISVAVGVVVVALTFFVGMVRGNLLDLAFKVVNLLTAPLFGLFFMALFVRWATRFGTFVGAAFGLATVVLINYWKDMGLDTATAFAGLAVFWAMPFGLLVQVVAGCLASLVPIGPKAAPMLTEGERSG